MNLTAYKIAIDNNAVDDDIYEHMIHLEIEEDIKKSGSFMFRISITLQGDGEWTYLKDERFDLFNKITISIGIKKEDVNPIFEGYITHIAPHFDPGEELCYLEVRGMDATCLMNLEEKLVVWTDQSHSDIASTIFNAYGITPEVESAPVIHTENGNALIQRTTDIRFLRDLAGKNGFESYVAVDESGMLKGYFKPYSLDGASLPPLAVHFENETNVQFIDIQVTGNLPLSNAGWFLNLEDKTIEKIEKSEYDQKLLGSKSLIGDVKNKVNQLTSPGEATSRVYKSDNVYLDTTELGNTLLGNLNQSGWFIKAKGIVNSINYGAIIRARQIIPVKGMGTKYSGEYFVSSVKHIISKGNYEQNIGLIRNAHGVTGSESFAGE